MRSLRALWGSGTDGFQVDQKHHPQRIVAIWFVWKFPREVTFLDWLRNHSVWTSPLRRWFVKNSQQQLFKITVAWGALLVEANTNWKKKKKILWGKKIRNVTVTGVFVKLLDISGKLKGLMHIQERPEKVQSSHFWLQFRFWESRKWCLRQRVDYLAGY